MNCLLGRHIACQHIGQAALTRKPKGLLKVSFAQVGVDQQYALAGLRHDDCEIAGDKTLAHPRRCAGDEHAVVAGLHQSQLQGHTQIAQALDSKTLG
ncbi:hypothetical protein D3C71_1708010 [compost metagenome]